MDNKTNKNANDYLRIIPLGGLGEIGKNMMVLELDKDIIIIDCGVKFPDFDMHGIDLVIPDMRYVIERKDRVKAILITHGHEDHIGALPYLLKHVNAPVYGSNLTIELIKARLEETTNPGNHKLITMPPRKKIKLGGISFEFIRTNHSISESYAIALYTRVGTIIHTGDFKIDLTPVDNKTFDFYKFATLGENGVLALFSDSTNVERDGFTQSEREISLNLRRTIEDAKGRIVVATFSSNIHRIHQIIKIGRSLNKKIALGGRSMHKYVTIAANLGQLELSPEFFMDAEELDKYPRDETMLIVTGSQGEPMSALSLMSQANHKVFSIKEGDTAIISASVIPGNEKTVSKVIDGLFKMGVHVVYEGYEDIHVSGHGSRQELKLMLALVKPKFFMPVHGNFRHLVHHANIAEELGVDPHNIVIAQDGDIIELNNDEIKKKGNVGIEIVLVDGKIVGDVGERVLFDRQMISSNGIVIAIVPYSKSSSKIGKTEIITRGFVYVRGSKELLAKAEKLLKTSADEFTVKKPIKDDDFTALKSTLKNHLKDFFYNETERNPMILVRVVLFE